MSHDDAPPPKPHASRESAHDYLAPILFAMVSQVREGAGRVVESARRPSKGAPVTLDPEAIHDMRVALRRLRTTLRPARALYGKKRLRPIEETLRSLARVAGAVRDEEVLREILGGLELAERPRAELERWLAQRARQERARRRAVTALLAPAKQDAPLALALASLERRVGRRRKDHPTEVFAEKAMLAARRKVEELHGAHTDEVAAMHELRIACKRVRYTAELFAPFLGEKGPELEKSSTRLQKLLGKLHDVDEALLRIGRARGLSKRGAGEIKKALHHARKACAHKAKAGLDDERPRLSP